MGTVAEALPAAGLPPAVAPEAIVYVNGRRRVLPDGHAEATLLEYLREIGLAGTKLGCGEGGCGACTVMVSHYDVADKRVVHRSVNACLAPLYSVEGMAVVTVEGIGNARDGLHPVQCGFCTPGFVMSMYSLLRSSASAPTEEEIEENLAGNLCRCTGYRPILDAFRAFAKGGGGDADAAAAYTRDARAAADAPTQLAAANGNGVCPSTGLPCACKGGGKEEGGGCCSGSCDSAKGYVVPTTSKAEPIFPPELVKRAPAALQLNGAAGALWHRPVSLAELLALKARHPKAKLVVGNSEVGIEMKFKAAGYPVLVGTTAVPELNVLEVSKAGIAIGASVTLSRLMDALRAEVAVRPKWQTSACRAIVEQLRWFAGNQIRNVASVGGNVCTASPISDLNPLWIAAGAEFRTASAANPKGRAVLARDFFLGYRKVDLAPDEVLLAVFLPWTRKFEYVREYKQAHRRDDDIAIVNAGIRVALKPAADGGAGDDNGGWFVEDASIAFGGVAALTISAKKTEAALAGAPWTRATLDAALESLRNDVVVADTAPGGMPEFRRSLAASFLFKAFVAASYDLEADAGWSSHGLPSSWRSAVAPLHRPPARGLQYYQIDEGGGPAGMPLVHMSADLQVSGEAEYADDLPLPAGGLHAALVLSSKPHARLLSVDASAAEAVPGFAGYYDASHVPGGNDIGPVVHDEEVFATSKVTCVGQVIGVVVAETLEAAKMAARHVRVEYEPLPPLLSIEDAVAAGSFMPNMDRYMATGDVDEAFASGACDGGVLEGDVQMGGQEHFYLEPNCTLVWTVDAGSEVHMVSSTQAPQKHQQIVAHVLGLPMSKVVCRTKRLGGGFGGKESRTVFIAAAAAVPAFHLRRPVKLTLDRNVDMAITGTRHPFLAKYKVGFTKEGRLLALDLQLYANAGNTADLSCSVSERAMFHSDNVYAIPNVRINARVAKTNLPSNTAFRGFGGPQGMIVAENWLERVALAVGKPRDVVQELNFHPEGYETHYGQRLERCQIQRIWAELMESSEFARRRAEVDAFNATSRWRKRGLASTPTKFGISFTTKFMNQAGALVHIYTDGTVLVTHGGVEMGQGLHTKVAQVAAAALNIPLSSVFIAETSTDKVPNSSPTAASASSDMYGAAVLNACNELKARMKPVADVMPAATLAQVATKCWMQRIDLSAHGFYITPDIGFDFAVGKGMPFNYYTFGAAFAEAEIDTLTGDFHLRRVDILMDLGTSLNPAIDVGQIEGAYVQGMGWALTEELKWGDKAHLWVPPGVLFTQGPGTYKLPTVNDIPIDFRVGLLKDAPNPRAVMSSKAVGEPPLFLASSAMFAVKDAIYAARKDSGIDGWFVLDTPATPERIRMACCDDLTAPFAKVDFRARLSV
eukprot:SM000030S11433  [mRNA]  locus=s30:612063:618646:- [translate_table: standard]